MINNKVKRTNERTNERSSKWMDDLCASSNKKIIIFWLLVSTNWTRNTFYSIFCILLWCFLLVFLLLLKFKTKMKFRDRVSSTDLYAKESFRWLCLIHKWEGGVWPCRTQKNFHVSKTMRHLRWLIKTTLTVK